MTSNMISIDPNKRDDMNHRYLMPEPIIMNQGKGCHGKSTVIKNLKNLAESLSLPEEILSKLLAKSLNTSFDDKTKSFAGSFKLSNIKKYIDSIIEDVVLCPNCRSPELSIPDVIKKGKKDKNWSISYTCNGCGYNLIKQNNTFSTKNIIKYLENSNKKWIIKKGNSVQSCELEFDNLSFDI